MSVTLSGKNSQEFETLPKLNFCANLSMMFLEHESVLDRYKAAAAYGFKAVEFSFPYHGLDLSELGQTKRDCKLEQILINSFPGENYQH